MERRANVIPEFDPVVFWNGQKHFDNFGVELRASTAANFRIRVRHGKRVAIGPVVQHGIESIGDGDDARAERNLFTAQATWIVRTIEGLMVGEDDIGGVTQERDAREHVAANVTMRAHDHLFGVVERPRPAKNRIWDGHLADIMKKSGASENTQILERKGTLLAMEIV